MKVTIVSSILLCDSALIYRDIDAPWVSNPVPDYVFDNATGCITEEENTNLCLFPDISTFKNQAGVPCPQSPSMTYLRL